jgi:hypothetical protein
MPTEEVFHQPSGAFGKLGCSAIFLLLPTGGAVGTAYNHFGTQGAAIAVGCSLAVFVALPEARLGEAFVREDDFGPLGRKPAGGPPPSR